MRITLWYAAFGRVAEFAFSKLEEVLKILAISWVYTVFPEIVDDNFVRNRVKCVCDVYLG